MHFVLDQISITQSFAHRHQRALREVRAGGFKVFSLHGNVDGGLGQLNRKSRCLRKRQGFLAGARRLVKGSLVRRRQRVGRQPRLGQRPADQRAVIVVAAQRRVSAGGDHLEHALRQTQDRDVKGAAAQVVHGINALAGIVQAVGNGCRRGLVDQAQHIKTGQLRCILGGLALGVVKIRRHRNDRAVDVIVKRVFGALAQQSQNFSADFDRTFFTGNGLQRHHAWLVIEVVSHLLAAPNIVDAAPHQALGRRNCVAGILHLRGQRIKANLRAPAIQVTHYAG